MATILKKRVQVNNKTTAVGAASAAAALPMVNVTINSENEGGRFTKIDLFPGTTVGGVKFDSRHRYKITTKKYLFATDSIGGNTYQAAPPAIRDNETRYGYDVFASVGTRPDEAKKGNTYIMDQTGCEYMVDFTDDVSYKVGNMVHITTGSVGYFENSHGHALESSININMKERFRPSGNFSDSFNRIGSIFVEIDGSNYDTSGNKRLKAMSKSHINISWSYFTTIKSMSNNVSLNISGNGSEEWLPESGYNMFSYLNSVDYQKHNYIIVGDKNIVGNPDGTAIICHQYTIAIADYFYNNKKLSGLINPYLISFDARSFVYGDTFISDIHLNIQANKNGQFYWSYSGSYNNSAYFDIVPVEGKANARYLGMWESAAHKHYFGAVMLDHILPGHSFSMSADHHTVTYK